MNASRHDDRVDRPALDDDRPEPHRPDARATFDRTAAPPIGCDRPTPHR